MATTNQPHYTLSRLNPTTHLIIQNDKYLEFPYIYVKTCTSPRLLLVVDTGCGAHNGKDGTPDTELKDFIEEQLFPANSSEKHEFVVICTHCHFDHIGGIAAFSKSGSTIFASGYDKRYLDPENRSANSLCEAFGTPTPEYTISTFLSHGERLTHNGTDLGLVALHTPGHTPDSMAVYDEGERWVFTGDTLYRRLETMPWGEVQDVPIILPLQGDWRDFVKSMELLLSFVKDKEEGEGKGRVRLAAGHTTSDAPAAQLLTSALEFVGRVEKGEVPVVAKVPGDQVAPGGSLGEGEFWMWQEEGDPEFSLMAPETFRKDFRGGGGGGV